MKNLFAYTAPTSPYPEYLSINRTDTGKLTIAVRSCVKGLDGMEIAGNCGYIELPENEYRKLVLALGNLP